MCSHWQANSVASRRIRGVAAASAGPARPARPGRAAVPAAATCAQLGVGQRRPEEIAEPAGQFPVGDRTLARRPAGPSRADRGTPATTRTRASVKRNASSCGSLLLAQPAIKRAQLLRFRVGQRSAVGARGEVEQGVELLRLGVDQRLAERGRPVVDRLAQRLEDLGVGVLRGVFHQLQRRRRPASAHPG